VILDIYCSYTACDLDSHISGITGHVAVQVANISSTSQSIGLVKLLSLVKFPEIENISRYLCHFHLSIYQHVFHSVRFTISGNY
jgi:hypothetical protein